MLFDYVCGGELFSYLRNAGRFSTSTGKNFGSWDDISTYPLPSHLEVGTGILT